MKDITDVMNAGYCEMLAGPAWSRAETLNTRKIVGQLNYYANLLNIIFIHQIKMLIYCK